jgi:hypothetical protein
MRCFLLQRGELRRAVKQHIGLRITNAAGHG